MLSNPPPPALALSSDLGSVLPLNLLAFPQPRVPCAAHGHAAAPLGDGLGCSGNLCYRFPHGWLAGFMWTRAFVSKPWCALRESVSLQPRGIEPLSVGTPTPVVHTRRWLSQASRSFSVTQGSRRFAFLKCSAFWQTDQYFKNQNIPGINRRPLNWQSGVLGEKPWFKRSPSFQVSD